jgi:hypothetical protein
MKQSDFKSFSDLLNGVMDVYGRERSPTALALWFKVLGQFELQPVADAMAEHMRISKFAPTPADIVQALTRQDGRPTADEAWSMIPRSEYESVIWTDEMSKAFALAAPLLEAGDQVAARRAFIDRYESEVKAARAQGKPVNAWPSWGFDAAGRDQALAKAVETGLLLPQHAAIYAAALPGGGTVHPKIAALLGDAGAVKRIQ